MSTRPYNLTEETIIVGHESPGFIGSYDPGPGYVPIKPPTEKTSDGEQNTTVEDLRQQESARVAGFTGSRNPKPAG